MAGRVVIVGATGFVGARLIPVLHQRGHALSAISRRPPTDLPDGCIHHIVDLSPTTDWQSLLGSGDTVVHLADGFNGFEALPENAQNEKAVERFEATLNLARAAIGRGVGRFVYLSTIKAMCGTWAKDVLTEQSPVQPTSLYGRLKLDAEQRIAEMAKGTSTSLISLRFPIVFGAGAGGNFTRLIALADTPVPLPFAALRSRRSMISVTSLTDAIAKTVDDGEARGGMYLVHDGAASLPELIAHLRKGLARPTRLFGVPEGILRPLEALPRLGNILQRFTRPLEVCDDEFRDRFAWAPPVEMSDEVVAAAKAYRP